MNTDEILDIIVEYRLWFIIGGSIFLFAIIGFVADRKKVLPGSKKDKKQNNKKEQNVEIVEKDEPNQEVKTGEEQIAVQDTEDDDFWGKKIINKKEDSSESIVSDKKEEKEELTVDSNDVKDLNEDLKAEEKKLADKYDVDNNVLQKEDFTNNTEDFISEDNNVSDNVIDDKEVTPMAEEKVLDVVNDINKINQMEITEDLNKQSLESQEETEDKKENLSEKVMNEDLEDTMQISYSQLKEMVEDIIAENENQKEAVTSKENNVSESQIIPKEDSVADMPLPNLDSIDVDSINRQDEDEDDVWKF